MRIRKYLNFNKSAYMLIRKIFLKVSLSKKDPAFDLLNRQIS
jgi:hypothetical protein